MRQADRETRLIYKQNVELDCTFIGGAFVDEFRFKRYPLNILAKYFY
jgi:hypothetical protein